MKKIFKLVVLSSLLLGGVILSNNFTRNVENFKDNNLIEEALDYNNNTGVSIKQIKVGNSNDINVSKTWAQLGNEEGVYYLRYITAVTGPIKSVTYTRSSEKLGSLESEVFTLYKGVCSEDEVMYYDGTNLVNTENELTNNYYFACYTIKFTKDLYKDEKISAYVTVIGEDNSISTSTPQKVSLYELIEYSTGPVVTLSVDEVNLNVGEEAYIGDQVSLTKESTLYWSSDNTNVATVEDGFIKAVNKGSANITVSTPNGSMDTCVVTIGEEINSLFKLNYTSTSLKVGNTLALDTINGDNRSLSFVSSDTSILSVSADGIITANKTGYAKVTATDEVGNNDYCYVLVVDDNSEFVVDGNISDWYEEENAKYQGQTLNDLENTVRTVTVYSVLRENGIYFGGEAIHTLENEDYSTWYWNTNFEVFVTRGTYQEQKWVNHKNNASDVVANLNTIEDGENYKTTFEMFIPYSTSDFNEESFARIGWAFKNRGELIKVERDGGASFDNTDWWWIDLHCPNNMNEHWYIYQDGMFNEEKVSETPNDIYYTQNFDEVENGSLPSDWEFSINANLTTCSAGVQDGRLYLTSTSNNPVVTLNYIPEVTNYAVEFDMSLETAANATRWTGLVFDYIAGDSYWQAVIRQNGNVNIDRWLITTRKWSPTNGVTTTVGSLTYNLDYHIRVELNGKVVTYYVNGVQQAQVTLSVERRNQGKIGLSANQSKVYFDNFVVKSLEA